MMKQHQDMTQAEQAAVGVRSCTVTYLWSWSVIDFQSFTCSEQYNGRMETHRVCVQCYFVHPLKNSQTFVPQRCPRHSSPLPLPLLFPPARLSSLSLSLALTHWEHTGGAGWIAVKKTSPFQLTRRISCHSMKPPNLIAMRAKLPSIWFAEIN